MKRGGSDPIKKEKRKKREERKKRSYYDLITFKRKRERENKREKKETLRKTKRHYRAQGPTWYNKGGTTDQLEQQQHLLFPRRKNIRNDLGLNPGHCSPPVTSMTTRP